LHHVDYHELVDNPEAVSRELCQFLKIPFERAMLDLSNADFSSVYEGQHHEHLRRGLIERQARKPVKMNPAAVKVLQRYEGRWERLKGQWFGFAHKPSREPGTPELLYRRVSGRFFFALDDCKRSLFEFLPLTWLQSYRRLKRWYLGGRPVSPVARVPMWQECLQHYKTILASLTSLAVVSGLDFVTGPGVSVAPFYLIPVAILALRLGLRWATWASVICAVLWTFIPHSRGPHHDWTLFLWNSWMHFLVCQTVAVLLARVRLETPAPGKAPDTATTAASKAPTAMSEPSNAQL
jgi:hypothetical protein